MPDTLHIVCLDAPAPPNYGGAIDMFYKIKALHETGLKIILHYFDYKKNRNTDGLENYCAQIFSYKRRSFFQSLSFSKPHIVRTRINTELINRLKKDTYPILLEGIHCTGLIPHLQNGDRKILVRLHNNETSYYSALAATEPNFFKRTYYSIESRLLHRYQETLSNRVMYAAISKKDQATFQQVYGLAPVFFIPAFVPWQQVTSLTGRGSYCLYHGNLSIAENEAAAVWLIETVFSKTQIPFVIAGKNISTRLYNVATPFQHIRLQSNPTDSELTHLIQHAHINVLPDLNNTGVKVKVLHALFCGRFCITRSETLKESDTVAQAQTAEQYMGFLKSFMPRDFTWTDRAKRSELLHDYNNTANAAALNAHLY